MPPPHPHSSQRPGLGPFLRPFLGPVSRRDLIAAALSVPVLGLLHPLAAQSPRRIDGPEALRAALRAGAGGQVLALGPGQYGELRFGGRTAPAALVAADPANPPVIGKLRVQGAQGLRLEGLRLAYTFDPADRLSDRPFNFLDCEDVDIFGNRFEGDVARGLGPFSDGLGYGVGLAFRGGRGIRIEGNHIAVFHRGLALSRCRDLVVRNNVLTALRMDGMNFAEVQNVRIEANHIHAFNRSDDPRDHADMIQFWTNRTERPTENVTIRANILNSGPGRFTQSIFMRNDLVDRGLAGGEMFYRDLVIEENVILNGHLHGITVGETRGLTIRHNTLVQNPASAGGPPSEPRWQPSINVAERSRAVTIAANITAQIQGHEDQADWEVAGNLLVQNQNPAQPGHYNAVFQGMPGGDPRHLASYYYRPDGPAGQVRLGAAYLRR